MARRLNHRGWFVLVSIPADDGSACVDIFETPDGDFGFQHFRSNVEDNQWLPIGAPVKHGASIEEAAAAAVQAVPWLVSHTGAQRVLQDWLRVVNNAAESGAVSTGVVVTDDYGRCHADAEQGPGRSVY